MADITLTDKTGSINSGSEVYLQGIELTLGWKNLINADPYPTSFAVVEVDNVGFENPKWSVIGHFKTDQLNANGLTPELLVSFAKDTGGSVYLEELTGSPPFVSSTLGSEIKVVVDTFDMKKAARDDDGKYSTYSINFIEDAE